MKFGRAPPFRDLRRVFARPPGVSWGISRASKRGPTWRKVVEGARPPGSWRGPGVRLTWRRTASSGRARIIRHWPVSCLPTCSFTTTKTSSPFPFLCLLSFLWFSLSFDDVRELKKPEMSPRRPTRTQSRRLASSLSLFFVAVLALLLVCPVAVKADDDSKGYGPVIGIDLGTT